MRNVARARLARHLTCLTSALLGGLTEARHANRCPRVRLHGPSTAAQRGATVAFTLLSDDGTAVPYWRVEAAARDAGIALRGGCFCNPGCAEQSFGLDDASVLPCLQALGDAFSPAALSHCLGGRAVGAIRVSLGCGSVRADVESLLAFVAAVRDPVP